MIILNNYQNIINKDKPLAQAFTKPVKFSTPLTTFSLHNRNICKCVYRKESGLEKNYRFLIFISEKPLFMDILDPYRRTDIIPGAGRLLIAEPFLADPDFARSVILICNHDSEGTVGFVLNRISVSNAGDILPDAGKGSVIPIYDGGPVQPETLHIIHKLPGEIGGTEILPGIFWGGSYETLHSMVMKNNIGESDIRLFLGYSGWEKGQLEREMKEGSWIVANATPDLIFEPDTTQTWRLALKSLGNNFAYMANLPLHPQLN